MGGEGQKRLRTTDLRKYFWGVIVRVPENVAFQRCRISEVTMYYPRRKVIRENGFVLYIGDVVPIWEVFLYMNWWIILCATFQLIHSWGSMSSPHFFETNFFAYVRDYRQFTELPWLISRLVLRKAKSKIYTLMLDILFWIVRKLKVSENKTFSHNPNPCACYN